jgi:hypothetical protein
MKKGKRMTHQTFCVKGQEKDYSLASILERMPKAREMPYLTDTQKMLIGMAIQWESENPAEDRPVVIVDSATLIREMKHLID